MPLTRRQFAAALAAAGTAAAQAPGNAPETPEALARAVADDLGKTVATIRKLKVPIAAEPAFAFHAQ